MRLVDPEDTTKEAGNPARVLDAAFGAVAWANVSAGETTLSADYSSSDLVVEAFNAHALFEIGDQLELVDHTIADRVEPLYRTVSSLPAPGQVGIATFLGTAARAGLRVRRLLADGEMSEYGTPAEGSEAWGFQAIVTPPIKYLIPGDVLRVEARFAGASGGLLDVIDHAELEVPAQIESVGEIEVDRSSALTFRLIDPEDASLPRGDAGRPLSTANGATCSLQLLDGLFDSRASEAHVAVSGGGWLELAGTRGLTTGDYLEVTVDNATTVETDVKRVGQIGAGSPPGGEAHVQPGRVWLGGLTVDDTIAAGTPVLRALGAAVAATEYGTAAPSSKTWGWSGAYSASLWKLVQALAADVVRAEFTITSAAGNRFVGRAWVKLT